MLEARLQLGGDHVLCFLRGSGIEGFVNSPPRYNLPVDFFGIRLLSGNEDCTAIM